LLLCNFCSHHIDDIHSRRVWCGTWSRMKRLLPHSSPRPLASDSMFYRTAPKHRSHTAFCSLPCILPQPNASDRAFRIYGWFCCRRRLPSDTYPARLWGQTPQPNAYRRDRKECKPEYPFFSQ
ncbi:hypothetical protein PMAYCL1PPCAC_22780, partial [Pristionchus mayeri]